MERANFGNDQKVTKDDLNYIESSKSLEIRQRANALLPVSYHPDESFILPNMQQSGTDSGNYGSLLRKGVCGGPWNIIDNQYGTAAVASGSNPQLQISINSSTQFHVNRGWALTEDMELIKLPPGGVTINKGDQTSTTSWTSIPNSTLYIYAQYQESSASVQIDSQGNSFYTRYDDNYIIAVSANDPFNTNQVPLATFTSDGSGAIVTNSLVDTRSFLRAIAIDDSVYIKTPVVPGMTTLAGHIHATGSGTPSNTNPHGLSLSDLNYTPPAPPFGTFNDVTNSRFINVPILNGGVTRLVFASIAVYTNSGLMPTASLGISSFNPFSANNYTIISTSDMTTLGYVINHDGLTGVQGAYTTTLFGVVPPGYTYVVTGSLNPAVYNSQIQINKWIEF